MLPINKKISAYNHYDYNTIKYIVVHDVGTRSTAKNNVDYFSGGNRNASAHYFVDDTSIWQSVEDNKGAWHVGDNNGVSDIYNTNSIGIEMCLPSGTVTAKTEANTLDLVKHLMTKYNVPASRVVRHYDASRKNCPAQFNLDGKWTRWFAFKAKLTSTATTTTTATKSKFKVGDKVKVKALYVSSTGGGKSTKSAGKIGTIKRDVGKGKRYLIENWGWAHENDIELVVDNTYAAKKVGDTVTVQKFATNYQTGQKIKDFVKGSKYKIKQVKPVNQSKSKRAYLLEGINSWVLEQDVK